MLTWVETNFCLLGILSSRLGTQQTFVAAAGPNEKN